MTGTEGRAFDLIVWGATGFTGRLVAEAVARSAPTGFAWAVAGRDRSRLEAVRDAVAPAAGVVVADVADPASLAALARSTRAVVTTVGPYARYGTPLVAACVAAGTHVADLTGEPTWMRATIDRFDAPARAAGVRVVQACGFDSVPSDLGVWWLQQRARERFGRPCTRVEHVFGPMAGGVSGGTVASMLALFDDAVADPTTRRQLGDRDLLAPGAAPSLASYDPPAPHREAIAGGWSVPFPMAAVNARVVRRTRALLGEPWGEGFRYRERWRFASWPTAAAVAMAQVLAPVALALPPVRRALARRLPAGAGPDAEVAAPRVVPDDLDRVGRGRGAARWSVGSRATSTRATAPPSRMLAAMGIGLATEAFAGAPAGVVTPAVVGGAAYVARLEAAGDPVRAGLSARPRRDGAPARIRTWDRPLRRRLLCPLSYGCGHGRPSGEGWSGRRESNPRHTAWKAVALPAELLPRAWPSRSDRRDRALSYVLAGGRVKRRRRRPAAPSACDGRPRGTARACVVGATRFELVTPCSQSRCATRLRHAPKRGRHRSAVAPAP